MSPSSLQNAVRILQEMLSPEGLSEGQLRKRGRIIEVSTGLFLRHGYRRTSVDEIARESHVAKGTVYTYFKNKAELLIHAIAAEKAGFVARLAPVLDGETQGEQRLRAWLRLVFEVVHQMPLTSSLMRGDREVLIALEEIDPSLADFFVQQQHAFLDQMIAEAAGDESFTAEELGERGQVLLAIAYSATFITDKRVRGGIPQERFARLIADALIDGIAHRTNEPT